MSRRKGFGRKGISIFTLLLIFHCLPPGAFPERLCATRDGRYEKLFSVFENEPDGTFIGTLDVIGKATGDDRNVSLRIVPSGERCGPIECEKWVKFDPETQNLTLNVEEGQTLDKDGTLGVDTIEITVSCTPRTDDFEVNVLVTIKVEDVNDNSPQFVGEPYYVEVNELTRIGTELLQVYASDEDKSAHLSYVIQPDSQGWSSYFSIPRATEGRIVLTKMLDFESLYSSSIGSSSLILLEVDVVNRGRHGEVVRRNRTTVTIKVLDGDDHPPVFEPCTKVSGVCVNPTYEGFVQQETMSNDAIQLRPAKLYAFDPDLEINEEIIYTLVSGTPHTYNTYFSVAPSSGKIFQRAVVPPQSVAVEYTLYVRASQVDNEDMQSTAVVNLKVVKSAIDQFPPVILNGETVECEVVRETADSAVFVRSLDSSRLQLQTRDDDYPRDSQPQFKYYIESDEMEVEEMFEITHNGLLIAILDKLQADDRNKFVLRVGVENTDAVAEENRFGESITLIINMRSPLKISGFSTSTRSDNCTTPLMPESQFVAAFGIFCGLFIVCVAIIIYLVVKLRKYKAMASRGSHPYAMNQSFGQKYDGFSFGNNGYRGDADSFTSSGQTAVSSKQVLSESIERIGHMIKAPPVDDDIPHIAPLEAIKKAKKQKTTEDVASIVPYRINTPVHAQKWKNDVMEHSLDFDQIRVENWLSEARDKKCGVGEVNLGSPRPCFVKILTGQFPDKEAISDDVSAMNQVLHFSACKHPNIVKFYGSCVKGDSLYIVNEFVSSRDLRNVLISSRMLDHSAVISSLSGAQLLNFVIGIAEGLFYLHDNEVLHASLCASNIRVNDSLTAKLSECCAETSQRFKLTSKRWMAPEIVDEQPYTEKSDVWSFGVTVWEILSLGGTPFDDLADQLIPGHVQRQISTGGSILPVTRNTTKRFWMLLQRCWAGNPLDRPNLNEIKTLLCKMKANSNAITVAKPPGYHFFPASTVQC